jgi:dephospho-CoA kinase
MSSEHPERTTFTVALTGGIASGKSAVADRFVQLGATLIDADLIAHQLVQPNQEALTEIVSVFGRDVVAASGALDRKRMREFVFTDTHARRRLESILHPRIHAAIVAEVGATASGYAILAIPLFIEVRNTYSWIDRVLVTDVPRSVQIRRLTRRPQIDVELAERILDAQAPRERRLEVADDVVDNTAPISRLTSVVERLHARYSKLALR